MKTKSKSKKQAKTKSARAVQEKTARSTKSAKSKSKTKSNSKTKVRVVNKISPPRASSGNDERRKPGRGGQFAYMKAPGIVYNYEVGDTVEVYCDHEKNKERVRGWIKGIVVQVDNKLVAVQFRSNVFLTDGWMVPDRILWYPLNSEHIRPVAKKTRKKEAVIPEY